MSIADKLTKLREYAYEAVGGKPKVIQGEVMFANPLQRLFGQQKYDIYNQNELLSVKGYKIIDKMLIDDQVKAALHLKKLAITAPGYEINNPDGVEGDYEPTEFIREVFEEMEGTFTKTICEMLTCLDYGYSITEKVWQVDKPIERLGGKKMIVMSALKTRSPRQIQFMVDGYGNVLGVKQESREIPIDKLIIYTHEGRFGNPFGTPDLHAAYRAWWIKDNAYKWMAMLLERMGIPPVFFLYSNAYNAADVAALKLVVESMQAGTGGAIPRPTKPEDLEPWAPELADNVSQVFIPTIEHLNKAISRAILVPALLGLSDTSREGALARSQTEFEVFMMVIDGIRQYLGQAIIQEQVIEPLIQLNFPAGTEQPKFSWKPLKDEIEVELYNSWNSMVSSGVVTAQEEDEATIRTKFKMPPLSDDGKAAREAAQKMKDEKAKAELKQMTNPAGGLGSRGKFQGDDDLGHYKLYDVTVLHASATDYAAVVEHLDSLELEAVARLRTAITESRDDLLDSLRRKGVMDVKFANEVTLRRWSRVNDVLGEMLRAASDQGQADALDEITSIEEHAAARRGMTPTQLIQYLSQKTIFVSGVLKDSILKDVKNALLNGVKTGATMGDIIDKVTDVFVPWLGDPVAIDDPDVILPHRTETLVRTNLTDGYNQGRLNRFRDPKLSPFIIGIQYSAILDERTTEVCSFLHGKVFKPGDPALDQLTPPNHFNCRSLLVPIMVDQPLKSSAFITPGEVGQAKDMAGKGFLSIEEYDHSGDGVWRTINGRKVFIKAGESAADAIKRSLGPKKENTHTKIRKLIKLGDDENATGSVVSKKMAEVITYAKGTFTNEQISALTNYVGSSSGLNTALRQRQGDLSKFPQDGSGIKSIRAIDGALQNTKNFALPITVHRGVPGKVVAGLKKGDTFTDHGYVSTTFSRSISKSFSEGTRLEIKLPKGFKFISVPSAADHGLKSGHAKHEAEVILPRSTVFRIRSINKGRIVVDAVASSIQGQPKTWKKVSAPAAEATTQLDDSDLFAREDVRKDRFIWGEGQIVLVEGGEPAFTDDDFEDNEEDDDE